MTTQPPNLTPEERERAIELAKELVSVGRSGDAGVLAAALLAEASEREKFEESFTQAQGLYLDLCKTADSRRTKIAELEKEIERLKEFEWKYKELCK
jgi:uncharacterized protein YoaH (UPF0181 family)